MDFVEIYTDGSCLENPGAGGWCAILSCAGYEKVISGGDANTTNNRMELTAIINGLRALKRKCNVTIYSDSTYCMNPFLNGHIFEWEKAGFYKGTKKECKNYDLLEELLVEYRKHNVKFKKVLAHSGIDKNEKCDLTAKAEAAKFQK